MKINMLAIRLALVASIALVFAGCAVKPKPLTTEELKTQASEDLLVLEASKESVDGPITLQEAMARAVKYNLDYRQKLLEAAVAAGDLDVSRFDMLPRLAASAGYTTRSNIDASTSQRLDGPSGAPSYSTSQERHRRSADAILSWNILDFGLSYYRAKQQGDRLLIAQERRRRALQLLLSDVQGAYWRVVGAQALSDDLDALTTRVLRALAMVEEAQEQGLSAVGDTLIVKRELLTTLRRLTGQRDALKLAEAELASLMNLRPGTSYEVVESDVFKTSPFVLSEPVGRLEQVALVLRPELAEENYQARINRTEARAAILSLMPGISLTASQNYDGSPFLLNNTWTELGTRATHNVLSLLALPSVKGRNEAQEVLDRTRRLALSVAIVTQVNLAYQNYQLALRDLGMAAELDALERANLNDLHLARLADAASELAEIQAEARALAAKIDHYYAFANLRDATARLLSSVGLPTFPEEVLEEDLASVSLLMKDFLEKPLALHLQGI